jgi:hypothetical protein
LRTGRSPEKFKPKGRQETIYLIIMKRTKFLKNDSDEEVAAGKKGTKKKPKLYPVPEEDSFVPLQEDSEEIKYTTKKSVS